MDIEVYLEEIENLLAEARPLPLTTTVLVNRQELEDLVAEIRAALPEELRQARHVLRERDEVLEEARREGEQVREDARAEAQRLAAATEIARMARREAERLVAEAREQARDLKLEAEDYVDDRLEGFQQLLTKALDTVARGREEFRAGSTVILDDDNGRRAPRTPVYDQEHP
jgi:cell division septum initiation protein DivIVA